MVIFTSHRVEILTREISSAATLPDVPLSPPLLTRAVRPDANCDELGGLGSGPNPQHEVKWCGYPQTWAAWPCNLVWWRHCCSAIGVAWPQWQGHAAGSALSPPAMHLSLCSRLGLGSQVELQAAKHPVWTSTQMFQLIAVKALRHQ